MAKRILLIEDDEAVADLVEMVLAEAGHRVEHVSSAEDGLREALAIRPDLVMLDLTLLGMSGQSFFRICKTDLALADLPIVVMSGTAVTETTWTDATMPDAVLLKPFDIDELCGVVSRLVGGSAAPAGSGQV